MICNDIQCTLSSAQTDRTVPGLRGVLSFYHVENLTIRDFETLDLPNKNFAIHICDFKNIMIEKVHIEGRKDGIHLGYGRGFVIRQGIFKTYDDPIALNAHDYATSNPGLGWIEDGLIEDCCDLNDVDTTGYFCRILAGSWVDWVPGMKVQHSDTVHYHNRLYRVFMQPDGTEYISIAPPVHEKGTCRYDGIDWVMVRESNMHNCGCRNIIFKNIVLAKNRPVAFSFHFDNDRHSRSVYPGSDKPVQTNIVFDHITLKAQVPVFLSSVTPMEGIVIKNTALRNTDIKFGDIDRSGISFEN